MRTWNEEIDSKLVHLRESGLWRELRVRAPFAGGVSYTDGGKRVLNFSSNDYLGLTQRTEIREAACYEIMRSGVGSCSSRLMTGNFTVHQLLEEQLAKKSRFSCSTLFSSGYLANLGVFAALASRSTSIIADKLVHASLIDGAINSRASFLRFRHNDVEDAERLIRQERERSPDTLLLLVTESVFSMDGDIAPVAEFVELSKTYDCLLIVDEAHAFGVFGSNRRGILDDIDFDAERTIVTLTLSKAVATYGGVCLSSKKIKELLVNSSRSLIYNTSLPPAMCAASMKSLDILDRETGGGEELLSRANRLRSLLDEKGLETMSSSSQIVPVVIGSSEKAIRIAKRLEEKQILVTAIRPPTVPAKTERLRISVTLSHTEEDLQRLVNELSLAVSAEAKS